MFRSIFRRSTSFEVFSCTCGMMQLSQGFISWRFQMSKTMQSMPKIKPIRQVWAQLWIHLYSRFELYSVRLKWNNPLGHEGVVARHVWAFYTRWNFTLRNSLSELAGGHVTMCGCDFKSDFWTKSTFLDVVRCFRVLAAWYDGAPPVILSWRFQTVQEKAVYAKDQVYPSSIGQLWIRLYSRFEF